MNFNLNEEQLELQKSLAKLCAEEIAPKAAEIDAKRSFPEDAWKKLAGAGFFSLMVPEQYGGKGADLISGVVALEEVAAACSSTAMAAGTSAWCAAKTLEAFATDAIKEQYLPALAKGEAVGAFATTEASAGSDLSAMITEAKEEGGGYVLTGGKSYVTNAPFADFIIVLAKTGDRPSFSAFLVPKDTDGLRLGSPLKTMGTRGALACPVKLVDCKVPAKNLLGEFDGGLNLALGAIDYTRLSIAAISIGIARAAFMTAKKHAETRVAFGKPIGLFQDVAFSVADMYIESDVSRQLLYHTAWQKHEGMKCSPMVAAAKISAAEVAVKNSGRAVSILAGKGCQEGEAAERLYRDAKMMEFAGGTTEILRTVIAKDMLEKY